MSCLAYNLSKRRWLGEATVLIVEIRKWQASDILRAIPIVAQAIPQKGAQKPIHVLRTSSMCNMYTIQGQEQAA